MDAGEFKHRIKILVVGDRQVGKTGFVDAYLKGKKYRKTTEKWAGKNVRYLCTATTEDGQGAEIDLWNTARSEYDDFGSLSLAYPVVTLDTSVFILCFSLIDERSLSNIEAKWVLELRDEPAVRYKKKSLF